MDKREIIIIDADTGIDDSLAIAVASYFKQVDIRLIVSTSGNIDAKQSAKNTKNILNIIDRSHLPVAIGALKPVGDKTIDISVHGSTGLGEYVFEEKDYEYLTGDIADIIHDVVENAEKKIKYLCLGPASSLAIFLKKYPKDIEKIERVYFSGGLIEETKAGELPYMGFNVAYDPTAMEVLVSSGVPITICPSDMGHIAYLNWFDVVKLKKTNKTGEIFEFIFRSYRDRHVKEGIATHDLCAFFSIFEKTMFKFDKVNLLVKYYKGLASGVLDIDFNNKGKFLSARQIDQKKFKRVLFKTIKKMP